jgi:hypothetical protein
MSLAGIGVVAAMLVGPSMIAITADSLAAAGIPAGAAATLVQLATNVARMVLAFVIIGELFDIIKHGYQLFTQSASDRPPVS